MRCPECKNEVERGDDASEQPVAPRRRDSAAGRGTPRATVPAGAISVADAERRLAELSRLSSSTAPPATAPRSAGFFSNLVGIIGGGFLGIAAGYWLLNYFGGSQFDFLHIPLPLVAHTQPYGPSPADDESPLPDDGQPPATVEFPSEAAPFEPSSFEAVSDPSVVPASAAIEVASVRQPISPTDASPADLPAASAGAPTAPAQPPTYNSADLVQALADADAVLGCPTCHSTGSVTRVVVAGVREVNGRRVERTAEKQFVCEACRGRPTTRITQDVYHRLCRLAEVATYVEIDPQDVSAWQQRDATARVLLKAGEDRARLEGIGRLAGHLLNNRETDSRGILVGGTVREVAQHGTLHYTRIVLFGLPKEVTVVSTSRIPLSQHDRVLIAGAMIEEPAKNLPGFQGKQAVVVWGGLPVRLADDP